ncbi:MAG TPA: response regulator transcription factor [Rhodothermales bacterium]|nr:response regulator transcription factor [Rhodothermales bacterium]
MKQTIYIIDDNVFVREALAMVVEDEPDLEVCGVAETASEALDALLDMTPDLVLVDFSLPGMNGIELIERLRILKPHQRMLMLSGHAESAYAEQALTAGAKGYLLKGKPGGIMEGIRHVLAGGVYVSPSAQTEGLGRALRDASSDRHVL